MEKLKTIKKIIFIMIVAVLLFTTNVYAIMPKKAHDPTSLAIVMALRVLIAVLIIIYILRSVSYYKKSPKEKKAKIKNIIIFLILTAVICIGIYILAEQIYDAGTYYTTTLQTPRIPTKNN